MRVFLIHCLGIRQFPATFLPRGSRMAGWVAMVIELRPSSSTRGLARWTRKALDIAVDALEALQVQGRTIGVINYIEAMKDRSPIRVRATRDAAGGERGRAGGGE